MLTSRFPGFLRRNLIVGIAILLACTAATAQTAISTLAGSSPAIAAGNVDATGTAARFSAPTSVAVDAAGNLYIADAANHKIRKVTSSGVVTTLAGSGSQGSANGTGTAASFNFPQGLATDGANLYVADTFNHVIRKIVISSRVVTTLAGTTASSGTATGAVGVGRLNNPLGVAVSGTDLYVADTSNHAIRKVVISSGVISNFAGTPGTSGSTDGTGIAAFFKNPGAIAAEGTTNLYVADTANHTIRKIVIAGGGVVTTHAGTAGGVGGAVDSTGATASFKSPGGVVVSGTNLFVADAGNNTIRTVGLITQIVSTIAGSSGLVGNTDAIGSAARFQGPTGVGVNAAGTIYIADTNNHTIRAGTAAVAPAVSDPANKTILSGANTTFTAAVTGNPTPTIQWELQAAGTIGFSALNNTAPYSGVTTATLTVTGTTLAMSGDQFRATVSNGVGGAVSSAVPAVLTVYTLPTITTQPSTQTLVAGSPVTLSVVATGSPAPTYQWKKGGVNIAGATAASYTIEATAPADTGSYTVFIANIGGSVTSTAATLTVNVPPSIATQPQSATATAGQGASFAVVASGIPTPTYQWKKDGLAIGGATSASLTLSALQPADSGSYEVVVTNVVSSVSSAAAALAVTATPIVNATTPGRYVLSRGQSMTLQLDPAIIGAVVQWRRNGMDIAGATERDLVVSSPGYYQARYTIGVPTVTSAPIFVAEALRRSQIVGWGHSSGVLNIPTSASGANAITAGEYFSSALRWDGSAVAWGSSSSGRLTVPASLTSVVSLSTSYSHSLALKSDGNVVAWGNNDFGQSTIPPNLNGIVAVAAGYQHSLAVKSDGTVVAWGNSSSGATQMPSGLSNVVAVAAGEQFSIALKSDGTVVAWGRNDTGQTTVPVGLAGVTAIATGQVHVLALKSDGTVVAWGANGEGRATVPNGLSSIVAIAAGRSHSLALKADGAVVAWGYGGNGETAVPPSLNLVRGIAGGFYHSLILRESAQDISPIITTPPAAQTAFVGQNVTLSVGVNTGTGYATTYQWRKGGANITGATSATLGLPRIAAADAGSYDVVVTNWLGSATSAEAVVTVNSTAAVSMNVSGQRVIAPGGNLDLTATTVLPGPVTYQWRKNGQPIAGASSASYTVANATVRSSGVYQVVVTNNAGPLFGPAVFVTVSVPTQVRAWGLNSFGQTTIPAGLTNAIAVAAGSAHTLALRSDGTLMAWGDNASGQATIPPGLSGVAAVAASGNYSMALKADGTVVTWGGSINYTPSGLSNVIAVAAGNGAMALRADGTVVVWDGSSLRTDTPVGLEGVISIAAGASGQFLAAKSDGSVVAWGYNGSGQTNLPAGLGQVVSVAAGDNHSMALKSDGSVVAWGFNGIGQLNIPAGLTTAAGVAAGANHSVALRADGTVAVWGNSNYGLTAVPADLTNVFAVYAGSSHVVALRDTSLDTAPVITSQPIAVSALKGTTATFSVVATGTSPLSYQWSKGSTAITGATTATLTITGVQPSDAGNYSVTVSNGSGSATSSFVALTVPETPTFTAQPAARTVVALGGSATLTGTATGATSYQWKRNGQIIAGATDASLSITAASPLKDGGWYQLVASNATGPTSSAPVFVNVSLPARVVGWGQNSAGQTAVPAWLSNVVSLAGGEQFALALRGDGTVAAWGANNYSQATVPMGLSSVVAVGAGYYHSLAVKSDGTLAAWGYNVYGMSTIPSGLSSVVAAAGGYYHSLALKSDGTVVAWGSNENGQTSVPLGLASVTAVAAGSGHNLALKADGTVVAWGSNNYGQATVPSGLTSVVSVVAGSAHSIALKADGLVVAWGDNNSGQTTVPFGLNSVVAIAAGSDHSLALKADGSVVAWGNNSSGQRTTPMISAGFLAITGSGQFSLAAYDNRGDLAPSIITQPLGQSANRGKIVTLSVDVSVGSTFGTTYQWRRGGVAISGATNNPYQISGLTEAVAGTYDVVVTNYLGSVTSAVATVTLNASPIVNSENSGRYLLSASQSLTLQLDPAITGAIVQWRRNGMDIAGATGRSTTISSPGYYHARYSVGAQTVTSAPIFVLESLQRGQIVGWGSNNQGQLTIPASATGAAAIAASQYSSSAFRADGSVVSWGFSEGSVPASLSSVVAISTSFGHSVSLKSDGTVVAWGNNEFGQTTVPTGLGGVVSIAVGNQHSLAVTSDGNVVAWGNPASGAIQPPSGLSGVAAVAAGNQFSVALKSDGTVVAWGRNDSGQTTVLAGLAGVIAISAGQSHVLALKTDGTVVAWGNNGNGQTSVPLGLSSVASVAAGWYHSLFLKSDGSVVAVGSSSNGQTAVPAGLNLVRGIAGGSAHTLIIRESAQDLSPIITTPPIAQTAYAGQNVSLSVGVNAGTGYATTYQWRKGGTNIVGATSATLGLPRIAATDAGNYDVVVTNWLGAATSAAASVSVNSVEGVSMNVSGQRVIAAGSSQDLVATTVLPGSVSYQWRKNGQPILGATNANYRITNATVRSSGVYQVVVTNDAGPLFGPSVFISVSLPTQVQAWGLNTSGQSAVPIGLTNVIAVAGGAAHTLALKSDGTMVAWGSNSSGQATIPSGLTDVAALAAGGNYSMALKSDGTVVTWGGTINYTPAGLSNVTAIAAGSAAMALRADGTVVVWDGTSVRTDTPLALDGVVSIAASIGGHYLAAKTDGSVVAWGNNGYGQGSVPLGLTSVIAVAAGEIHSMALKSDGSVVAWGYNGNGQISVPAGLSGVVAITVSRQTSFALRNDDTVVAWGLDDSGVRSVPAGLANVFAISGGSSHTLALRDASTDVAPTIISATGSGSIAAGLNTGFNVTATGTAPFSYQWRKNGVSISSATNASFVLTGVSDSDTGTYDVIVSNAVGTATSVPLSLTVISSPSVITAQPVGGTLNVGNIASFRITATGSAPMNYQWRKNGSPIVGATSSAYILGAATAASAGSFDVVITNIAGSITSDAAVLTINPPVVFNAQPASVTTFVGLAAAFSAPAAGFPGTPTYQWRKDGVALSGATSSTFTLASVLLTDAGSYDVVATAVAGSATSNAAILAVSDSAPQITAQPVGTTLAVGGNTALAVAAVGSAPLSYQWRRDGIALVGATSAIFPIVNAQTYEGGLYTVVVINALGSVTSAAARLNVVPRVVAYSARLQIDADGAVAVFTVEGTLPKKVLLRAVGPGLAPFGFSGLPDPQLELFSSTGALLAINNDWATSADTAAISSTTAAVGAFALAIGSRDSAMLATLAPGTYTVRAKPASGAGGTGYLELYDADLATAPMSTLPYVAVRGRMGAGGGVVIGGLGSNGRGQRSYLVRAIGPSLGLPGAHANPAMLIVRDGTLVGSNDDWDTTPGDATATAAAITRVATFALPAGARDSALVLTGNLHAGACTVQVGGSDALGGTVLLELHDLDAARPATFAPAIVSSPVSTTTITGEPVTLCVLAQGTAPLGYQWRKDGIPLDGATTAILTFASAQPSHGGSYTVHVTNSLGTATSLNATLAVQSSSSGSAATQAVVGSGYAAGGTATITNTLVYTTLATGLGWKVTLPVGWKFVSDAGTLGDVRPVPGTAGSLDWAWSTPPVGPITFTYTVSVPPGTAGDQFIAASGVVRFDGSLLQPIATPSPLRVMQITTHSADSDADFHIGLVELTRVIELYNSRHGTTRTGRYRIQEGTEDGFGLDAATSGGAAVTLARFHSADSDRSATIGLVELTRVIELFNTRAGTARTGAYHVLAGTEDGFAPGP